MWELVHKSKKINSGFSLVELLVAVGVVVLVMVAVTSGVATSLRNSRYSKEKANSVRLAQEAIEELRRLRDREGWNNFTAILDQSGINSSPQTMCFSSLDASIQSLEMGNATLAPCGDSQVITGTNYVRNLTISYDAANRVVDMDVAVIWNDGSDQRQTMLSSSLREWK